MAKSAYAYMREAWQDPDDGDLAELQWQRLQQWREEGAVERVERPTRLDRARSLGYKAKQGIVVARVRVAKGTARKQRHDAGRRSAQQGVGRVTRDKNRQRVAEERATRVFPNLRVLNSYWVGEDGSNRWFEAILVDPHHPAVENDDDLNWICDDSHRGRAERGLTSAGKRNRGLQNRGRGAEHSRPGRDAGATGDD
jgi:large subunit ribosomal protein L15e